MRRLLFVGLAACASSTPPDPGLEALTLDKVAPDTIIPGTKVVVTGASFVDAQWGATSLHLTGTSAGKAIDVRWPATFVDFNTMHVPIDGAKIAEVGTTADFRGTAQIEVVSATNDETYTTEDLTLDLAFRDQLVPTTVEYDGNGVIFVNDQIQIDGDGFLLGGDEGVTVAKLVGCFTPEGGGPCAAITPIEIPMCRSSRCRASGGISVLPEDRGHQAGRVHRHRHAREPPGRDRACHRSPVRRQLRSRDVADLLDRADRGEPRPVRVRQGRRLCRR
ncbi:MAG: hypothetical protein WKG01_39345 [Kofleriaceae bacterium]